MELDLGFQVPLLGVRLIGLAAGIYDAVKDGSDYNS